MDQASRIAFHLVSLDGSSLALEPPREYVIGRGHECDLVLHDAMASRRHARLDWDATTFWWIEDLGSRNGMQVNDRLLHGRQQLIDGARIQIGGQLLSYLLLPPGADPGALRKAADDLHGQTTIRPTSERGELESIGATFTGLAEHRTMLELLQFLTMAGKQGRLDLFIPGHGMSWVFVEGGRFVDAGIDAERGVAALRIIACEPFARFAFFADAERATPASIDVPPQHLLMELACHLDEVGRT